MIADLLPAVYVLVVENGVCPQTFDEIIISRGACCDKSQTRAVGSSRASDSKKSKVQEDGEGTHSFANWIASVPVAVEPP